MKLYYLLFGFIFLISCTQEGVSRERIVDIYNFEFTPQTLNIEKGQSVTWVNNDDVKHTVTGFGLDKVLEPGETYTYSFIEEGVYDYICNIHPGMQGVIIVGSGRLLPRDDVTPVY